MLEAVLICCFVFKILKKQKQIDKKKLILKVIKGAYANFVKIQYLQGYLRPAGGIITSKESCDQLVKAGRNVIGANVVRALHVVRAMGGHSGH